MPILCDSLRPSSVLTLQLAEEILGNHKKGCALEARFSTCKRLLRVLWTHAQIRIDEELYNRWSVRQRERCTRVELTEPFGKANESPVFFEQSCE
jgi:hypothetical protein